MKSLTIEIHTVRLYHPYRARWVEGDEYPWKVCEFDEFAEYDEEAYRTLDEFIAEIRDDILD